MIDNEILDCNKNKRWKTSPQICKTVQKVFAKTEAVNDNDTVSYQKLSTMDVNTTPTNAINNSLNPIDEQNEQEVKECNTHMDLEEEAKILGLNEEKQLTEQKFIEVE